MKSEQGGTFLARNVSRAFWAIAFVCLLSTLVIGCDKLPEEPWELVHIAQGGGSLWSIGARYGTVPDALAAFNGSSSEVFEAGVRVRVPYRVITKNEMENVYRMGKHDSFDSYYDPDSELDRDVRAIIGDHDGDGNPTIIFAPHPSHDYGAGGKVARVFGMEIREQGSPVVLSRETFTTARVGVSLQLRDVAFDDKLAPCPAIFDKYKKVYN